MFRGIYQGDANNIKTAIFGACYDTDGSLTREAQNGYLLPRVVAIAAPPAIAVPELVVLTEEERQSKYSEIYQLAEELCRSTGVLPEKEKDPGDDGRTSAGEAGAGLRLHPGAPQKGVLPPAGSAQNAFQVPGPGDRRSPTVC